MSQISFYVQKENENIQYVRNKNINFKLVIDNWDDYGCKTLFQLYLLNFEKGSKDDISTEDDEDIKNILHIKDDTDDIEEIYIGSVKIMNINNKITKNVIEEKFSKLDNNTFCSLGQSIEYYENIKLHCPNSIKDILNSLNDIAINIGLSDKFESIDIFNDSLLRFTEASNAYNKALNIINNVNIENGFKFTYDCLLNNDLNSISVSFDFTKKLDIPNRIVCIVGKNGTGKTRFLARLAMALSGQKLRILERDKFDPSRPLFTKVIAISYSIFDQFEKPSKGINFSYIYSGWQNSIGNSINENTENIIFNNFAKINTLNRIEDWRKVLSYTIDENDLDELIPFLFSVESSNKLKVKKMLKLSSGEKILLNVITTLLANIKANSILLFDEPETHLHPNAISTFMKSIHYILKKYDSYAILATHSPIIIQETPSKSVIIFDKFDGAPIAKSVDIETFGENLSTINYRIFDLVEIEEFHKETFKNLSKKYSFEEINKMFDNKLSLNASIYLNSLFN